MVISVSAPTEQKTLGQTAGKQSMKRILAIGALALAVVLVVVYAGDYLILRYKIWQKHEAFATVTVYRYYAIQEKGNKTEYVFHNSEADTCVQALFPHLDDLPCWYLTRHTQQQTDI
jgi:hypothetical protein